MALINDVISNINAELNSSPHGIAHCIGLKQKLMERKESIENAMSLASTDFPSKVSEVVQEVTAVTLEINAVTESSKALSFDIKDHLSKSDTTTEKLTDYINDIDKLEKCISYLSWIKTIEDTCVAMEAAYLEKDEESCLAGFKMLSNYQKYLKNTACQHLLSYINDTVHFWHKLLEETFSKEFEEVLKVLKWPFVSGNVSLESPPMDALHRFQKLAELLIQLQTQEKADTAGPVVSSALLTEFALPPLPIRLLLRPLAKRFLYHFRGTRKTNRLDRPEWYLTQILTWIRDHSHFLTQWLQPALDQMEEGVNANVEFTRGLVRMVAEKLQSDLATLLRTNPADSESTVTVPLPDSPGKAVSLSAAVGSATPPSPSPSLQSISGGSALVGLLSGREELFSHLIDEVLSFEKELRGLEYPDSEPGLLPVITQANVFVWWIHVEMKNAGEKMDQILFSDTAWQPLGSKELDDMKVTECGDSFLSLLMTITERYKNLPQPGHRLQFLDLQLYLLEDFRMRVLQQLHAARENPLGPSLSAILNTLAYISHVLRDWSDTPHFLQLQFYMMQFDKLQSFHEKRIQISIEENYVPNVVHMEEGKSSDSSQTKQLGDDAEDLDWTVFDQTLALFSHLESDLLDCICEAIMVDIKDKSRLYRSDKWFAMQSPKEYLNPCLSPSACPMFEVLSEHLHWLKDTLSVHLLTQAWQILCSELNKFLYQKLVLVNKFSEGGALQLQFDMTRNLFPLFRQFTEKPENHFKEIKEVCFLLTISKGSALLLREALDFPNRQGSSSEEEDEEGKMKPKDAASLRGPARVLAEMGVHKLTPAEAKVIIDLRTDLLSI